MSSSEGQGGDLVPAASSGPEGFGRSLCAQDHLGRVPRNHLEENKTNGETKRTVTTMPTALRSK